MNAPQLGLVFENPSHIMPSTHSESEDMEPQQETIGETCSRTWKQFQETFARHVRELRELNQGEVSFIDVPSDYNIHQTLETAAAKLMSGLILHASRIYAPVGTSLEIDSNAVTRRFPINSNAFADFNPAAIWQYLEETYGGNAGETETWRQTAKGISDAFFRAMRSEVVRKGNFVVLEKSVYLDSIDKKFSGKNKLSYSCCGSLYDAFRHLSAFARWAERHHLAGDLNCAGNDYYRSHSEIESRKQYPMGVNGEIVVVTYHNKFEFKVRADVAEQLQIFMGMYGEQQETH